MVLTLSPFFLAYWALYQASTSDLSPSRIFMTNEFIWLASIWSFFHFFSRIFIFCHFNKNFFLFQILFLMLLHLLAIWKRLWELGNKINFLLGMMIATIFVEGIWFCYLKIDLWLVVNWWKLFIFYPACSLWVICVSCWFLQ